MYDSEKGCMVFKDSVEKALWDSKCAELVKKEYFSNEEFLWEKWKNDGERFLKEDFIDGPSFPFLNDGRPELFEWINGTFLTHTSEVIWEEFIRLDFAYDFLLYTYHIYQWKKKSQFVEGIKDILSHLFCDKQCIEW